MNNVELEVVKDPIFSKTIVAKDYIEENGLNNPIYDVTKVEGVLIPIIKLNNNVLEATNIDYMRIKYVGFVPTIFLGINDFNGQLQLSDVPGMNNIITVVFVPRSKDTYRSIKLDFYITNANFIDRSYITYEGSLKYMPLEKIVLKSFPLSNTYTFFNKLASELKLGFTSSPNTSNIADNHLRFLSNKTYKDVIKEHISFSGLDNTSIFDTWIDLYGYLTFVNLYNQLTEPVKLEDLKIKAEFTLGSTSDDIDDLTINETPRILTNNTTSGMNNLFISSYRSIVDLESASDNGTQISYQFMSPAGTGENEESNTIDSVDIQILDVNNKQGTYIDEYAFQKYEYLGSEMDNIPILIQEKLRDKFLTKINSNQLEVTLQSFNFGIYRGMVLGVVIYEYEQLNKGAIVQSTLLEDTTSSNNDNLGKEKSESDINIDSDDTGVVNYTLTGSYYVNGMVFEYDNNSQEIIQKLFLIKREQSSVYSEAFITPKQ